MHDHVTIRAMWHGRVVAESDDTILVEGNHYFPPGDVRTELLEASPTSSHCPWKGDAGYHTVVVDGERNEDAAWYHPFEAAADIRDYVAFWRGVEVSGANPGEPEIHRP